MPARLVFRCQYCDAVPDPLTQLDLEAAARCMMPAEYLDVGERWLIWTGGGCYGSRRVSCAKHRGEMTAELRNHYGTLGPSTWKMPPYATTRRTAETDHAWPPAKFFLPGVAGAIRRESNAAREAQEALEQPLGLDGLAGRAPGAEPDPELAAPEAQAPENAAETQLEAVPELDDEPPEFDELEAIETLESDPIDAPGPLDPFDQLGSIDPRDPQHGDDDDGMVAA